MYIFDVDDNLFQIDWIADIFSSVNFSSSFFFVSKLIDWLAIDLAFKLIFSSFTCLPTSNSKPSIFFSSEWKRFCWKTIFQRIKIPHRHSGRAKHICFFSDDYDAELFVIRWIQWRKKSAGKNNWQTHIFFSLGFGTHFALNTFFSRCKKSFCEPQNFSCANKFDWRCDFIIELRR